MKLLSFVSEGHPTYGVCNNHELVAELGNGNVPSAPDLKTFLSLADAERTNAVLTAHFKIPVSSVAFLPVIPNPEKILCVGSNYDGHRLEAGRPRSGYPGIFVRLADSLTGHGKPMHL